MVFCLLASSLNFKTKDVTDSSTQANPDAKEDADKETQTENIDIDIKEQLSSPKLNEIQ